MFVTYDSYQKRAIPILKELSGKLKFTNWTTAEWRAAIEIANKQLDKLREQIIAEHACLKYSGRVGRSAAAKDFDKEAIRLAVIAHIRHAETEYDELLSKGYDRQAARVFVKEKVEQIS